MLPIEGTQEFATILCALQLICGPFLKYEHKSLVGDKAQLSVAIEAAVEYLQVEGEIVQKIIDAIYSEAEQPTDLGTTQYPLIEYIARLSTRHALQEGTGVSFHFFVLHSGMCQFLTQQQRVAAWVTTCLLTDQEKEDSKILARLMQSLTDSGNNLHSVHLLSFFRLHRSAEHSTEPASFNFVSDYSGVSQQELILQQCIQDQELNWRDLSLDKYPLEFLFTLLETYSQPLKLLATIPPFSLHKLLESTTEQRFPTAISILKLVLAPFLNENSYSTQLVCFVFASVC